MICNICNEKVGRGSMSIHLKVVHNVTHVDQEKYECTEPACFRVFDNKYALKRHSNSKHKHEPAKLQPSEPVFAEANHYDNFEPLNVPIIDLTANVLPSQSNSYDPSETEGPYEIFECTIENCPCKSLISDATLDRKVLEISTSVYSGNSTNRALSGKMINLVNDMLNCDYLNGIKVLIRNKMKVGDSGEIIDKIEYLQNCFSDVLSEHRRFTLFKKLNLLIMPESHFVGTREEKKNNKLCTRRIFCQYVPMDKLLKSYFECDGVYDTVMAYRQQLLDSYDGVNVSHIIQTDFWREESNQYQDGVTLPVFLYEDAYETGNALGPAAGIHKLNGVYFIIACLPPYLQTKLQNILMAQLYHVQDLNYASRKLIWFRIVECLKKLETEGIEINLKNDKTVKLYFKLALLVGDNLGLNGVLGFVESFGKANYYCRICKCKNDRCNTLTVEDPTVLRNVENYAQDVLTDNMTETGIKSDCVLNELKDFHVTKNQSLDLMHDFLEGICPHEMIIIMAHFIERKNFTLKTLNWRLAFCNLNNHNQRPPQVTPDNVSKCQTINTTASQMLTLVMFGGMIFGDLISNHNDEFWILYTLLREILYLILSPVINENLLSYLEDLIQRHHKLYIKLIGPLKPKHHFILHYIRVMRLFGPPRYYSATRFEGKHRSGKRYTNVTDSRVNLSYSLIVKHQLQLCEYFLNQKSFVKLDISYQKFKTVILRNTHVDYKGLRYCLIKQICIDGFVLKSDSIVVREIRDNFPSFVRIGSLYCNTSSACDNQSDFALSVKELRTTFNDTHQAFQVEETGVSHEEVVLLSELHLYKTYNLLPKNDKMYLVFNF